MTVATELTKTQLVHAQLAKIAATQSKTEKEELVRYGMEHIPLFKRVVCATYDPFITYGVKKAPAQAEVGDIDLSDPWPWVVLEGLASRKLSGTVGRDELQRCMNALTPEAASVFARIVQKDLRAGFTEGTVNRVAPKTIPEFPYMRCSLPPKSNMDKWDWSLGMISQEKADGMFVNIDRRGTDEVYLSTRQGSPIPLEALPELVETLQRCLDAETQTHGELEVLIDGQVAPREIGNGILNHIIAGGSLEPNQEVRVKVWDQIPLSAVKTKGKHEIGYKNRLVKLMTQLRDAHASRQLIPVPTRVCRSKDEALAHYRELLKDGKEGTVIKHPDAIWKDGTSKDQVKFKLEVPVELKVVGFNEGTGRFEGQLGSLQCASEDGLLEVDVSGRGDAMRAEVWANQADWLGAIVTVKANAVIESESKPGKMSLFLPIFIERRTDKVIADTLQQVKDQFAAAIAG